MSLFKQKIMISGASLAVVVGLVAPSVAAAEELPGPSWLAAGARLEENEGKPEIKKITLKNKGSILLEVVGGAMLKSTEAIGEGEIIGSEQEEMGIANIKLVLKKVEVEGFASCTVK